VLDTRARAMLAPLLDRVGARIAAAGVPPLVLTGAGWVAGAACCLAVAGQHWTLGLVLWLANRLLDGLDGPVARVRRATDLGGFLDIVADFSIYAGFVLAVAVAVPDARLACAALLTAYYVSGTAFLALSSLRERRRESLGDERSLRFVGGLAEGTETVIVYILFCLLPAYAAPMTAVQRVSFGIRVLRPAASHTRSASPPTVSPG